MKIQRTYLGVGIGMIIVLIIAGYFSWKQYERYHRIQLEVQVLESERNRVESENSSLQERIEYLATDSFQEKESKERLNMRKEREFVIDIESSERGGREQENVDPQESTIVDEEMPNYKKWLQKFFNE